MFRVETILADFAAIRAVGTTMAPHDEAFLQSSPPVPEFAPREAGDPFPRFPGEFPEGYAEPVGPAAQARRRPMPPYPLVFLARLEGSCAAPALCHGDLILGVRRWGPLWQGRYVILRGRQGLVLAKVDKRRPASKEGHLRDSLHGHEFPPRAVGAVVLLRLPGWLGRWLGRAARIS